MFFEWSSVRMMRFESVITNFMNLVGHSYRRSDHIEE